MQKSESITKLATALNKVQTGLTPVVRNAENPFFRSRFADLTAVWEHIRPTLTKEGLAISQTTDGGNLVTTLMHTSGEYISGTYPLVCVKANDPQALGSSMSYARRYALAAIVGAVTENEDDDGNTASNNHKATPAATPEAAKTTAPEPQEEAPEKPVAKAKPKAKEETHTESTEQECLKMTIEVPKLVVKHGTSKKSNKPYMQGSFKHDDIWYSTFSETLIDKLQVAQGRQAEISFTSNQYGGAIVAVEPVIVRDNEETQGEVKSSAYLPF